MERYTSKQEQIKRSAEQIYTLLSDFTNFTPMLQDKVEDWRADKESCSFKAQGFSIGMRFDELTPYSTIKVVADQDNSPIPFAFWLQLKEVEPYDTRIRVVLDVKLNMMMKMLVGSKIQKGLDSFVEQIAKGLSM